MQILSKIIPSVSKYCTHQGRHSLCRIPRWYSSTPSSSSSAPKSNAQPPVCQNLSWLSGGSLAEPLDSSIDLLGSKLQNAHDMSTKVTVLSNGLTVASQNKFGMHCTVGVIINAGPRFESTFTNGVSHFVEKLGFHSTKSFSGRNAIQQELEKCGAIFDCQISKDLVIYAASGLSSRLSNIISVLSETVLTPQVTADEMEAASAAINHELSSLMLGPPPDQILSELIHRAAFGHATLGLPRYAPEENINKITRQSILEFLATCYKPERMVLGGVGIPHEELVEAAEKFFLNQTPTWVQEGITGVPLTPDKAEYRGGLVKLEADLTAYHNPMPEYAHLVIGLNSCGVLDDKKFVPACLLNTLMGGGGSFSAGGPGKGMYSRLYLNVLNRYHWVNSALATNHVYQDNGVFTISASCEPGHLRRLVDVISKEMRGMSSSITKEEFLRAKKQLQSMLLMNLEFRAVVFEDLARQVLQTGNRKHPEYWVDAIDRLTVEDMRSLVDQMLLSPPSVAGFGRLDSLPSYEEICKLLVPTQNFSLFK